jgi:hypothetical protein
MRGIARLTKLAIDYITGMCATIDERREREHVALTLD